MPPNFVREIKSHTNDDVILIKVTRSPKDRSTSNSGNLFPMPTGGTTDVTSVRSFVAFVISRQPNNQEQEAFSLKFTVTSCSGTQ